MIQDIKHVNQVWRQMGTDLNPRYNTSNFMEICTPDYSYLMQIILLDRHDFRANVNFIHDVDRRNRGCRPLVELLDRSVFLNIDFLRDVAYDFADTINPYKTYQAESPFYEWFYPQIRRNEKEQINFVFNEVKKKSQE